MYLRNVSKRWLIVAATLVLPLNALAQSTDTASTAEPDDEKIQDYNANVLFDENRKEPDWIPTLRFAMGVNSQAVTSASIGTEPFTDFDGDEWSQGIRRSGGVTPIGTKGSNPIDGPTLGVGFEFMGPVIESAWGKPRPFLVFEYRDQLEGFTTIVRDQTGPPPTDLDATPSLRRMRAKGNVDQQYWLLAGIGAAFPLPIEGYNVKLKPSINYFYSKLELEPLLIQPVLTSAAAESTIAQFTRKIEDNQGIAPRIELDAEIYREGPFSVGFYLALDFLVILGGPTKHSTCVNSCYNDGLEIPRCGRVDDPSNLPPIGPGGDPVYDGQNYYGTSGTLRFDVERNRMTYQGSAGIRLSWMGGP